MQLAEATYYRDDGYATLRVLVDGEPAELIAEHKPTLLAAGIVFLGPEFADRVPPIAFRLPPSQGGQTRLEGFTQDPRLVRLYRDFVRATAEGTFEPGPVPIPA